MPNENAAAAIFDDGPTFAERCKHHDGVPQLLTYIGASQLRKVCQSWEVSPRHPGFKGATNMRWEFGQRATRKGLYDLLKKGCERVVRATDVHQPVDVGVGPTWRKSIAGCHYMKPPPPTQTKDYANAAASRRLEQSCLCS